MAYHDENGRITIDEVAAKNDVRKMEAAIDRLDATIRQFKQLMNKASESKGNTAEAVYDKSMEMITRLNKSKEQLQMAIDLINRTVKHYYELDKKLRDAILASESMK